MIKYILYTIIIHQNDKKKTLPYFNHISRNIQTTTSAKADAATSDQGKRFQALVQVVTLSQRHVSNYKFVMVLHVPNSGTISFASM